MTEKHKTESVLPVCAIILAAGESKRFGSEDKLLAKVDGVSILERVVEVIADGGVDKIIVVTGANHEAIESLLCRYEVELVRNEKWAEGMGRSLSFGTSVVDASAYAGLLVCLGDLPYIEASNIRKLIDIFIEHECQSVVLPIHNHVRGHPVIFPSYYQGELIRLRGDSGAKSVLLSAAEKVVEVRMGSDQNLRDIDCQDDLSY